MTRGASPRIPRWGSGVNLARIHLPMIVEVARPAGEDKRGVRAGTTLAVVADFLAWSGGEMRAHHLGEHVDLEGVGGLAERLGDQLAQFAV